MNRIRVLVIDDSAFMRKMLSQMLSLDSDIEVVGTAMDGLFALQKIKDLKPDVLTLDINMPRMDGIETLRYIVQDHKIPTIIVSSYTKTNAELTFKALEMGAFDFITKPQNALASNITNISQDLVKLVKAAYRSRIGRAGDLSAGDESESDAGTQTEMVQAESVLAIGASTGGPNALSYLLPQIPKDVPAALLIVQHMPGDFTAEFAERLNGSCAIEVKEAQDGDHVIPGLALIAPGDWHMQVKTRNTGKVVVIKQTAKVNGHRPSVDVLFRSVALEYGYNSTGLIMTGMGSDGADGIGEIMKKGGCTIAQSEESCVVFGMPRAAIDKKHINHVLDLNDISDFLMDHFRRKEQGYGITKA